MRYLIIPASLASLVLTACFEPVKMTWTIDQCKRAEVFQQCLRSVPAGPQATKYNDWAEVVSECDDAARYQSTRAIDQVKPECRSE